MNKTLNRIAVFLLVVSVAAPVFAQSAADTYVFAQSAADTYKAKCTMCHGADGLGTTPAGKMMKAVSFKDPAVVKASNSDLIAAVTNGKNKMPAYQGKLSGEEIKAVVAYVRTLSK